MGGEAETDCERSEHTQDDETSQIYFRTGEECQTRHTYWTVHGAMMPPD